MERTVPTKEQVLAAAEQCPQSKQALQILFPQDFEDDTPLRPGIYRNEYGMDYFLMRKGPHWKLVCYDGYKTAPDNHYVFAEGSFVDMKALRSHLSQLKRVFIL